MLITTMFDQPACTGRSTGLVTFLDDFIPPMTWEQNLTTYSIDTDTVFRSVILEPESELTLIDEHGASYNLVNFSGIPSCEELPDAKFVDYIYVNNILSIPEDD